MSGLGVWGYSPKCRALCTSSVKILRYYGQCFGVIFTPQHTFILKKTGSRERFVLFILAGFIFLADFCRYRESTMRI